MPNQRRAASLLSMAALVAVAGCNGLFGGDDAHLRVVLSSDVSPTATALMSSADEHEGSRLSDLFQSANVTLSSVLVRDQDGKLINVSFSLPVIVDVVKVEGGKQIVLPDGTLPAGTYDQVVFVISSVSGTTKDGTTITIDPPGGGWTAVVPICQVTVAQGSTQTVAITLNVRSSFLQLGEHWGFQPRFRSLTSCT